MQGANEISFGRFRLDLANECLWEGSRSISLRPKAFAVLKLLVEHAGQLVNKRQIMDTVWPGTFVGDAVLKDSIRQLREALEDDADSPVYIETAHRRGYRFIGKVTEQAPGIPNRPMVLPEIRLSPDVTALTPLPSRTRMLGREAELSQMRSWLNRALSGDRQAVFVTGEPGIGKTTLVQAFLEQAKKVTDVLVARGQCLEQYGAAEAYLPIFDGLSRLCRSPGGERVLTVLQQQAPTWLAQMPSFVRDPDRDMLQSQVAAASRERMLHEMTGAIEALTSLSPLLLVLEDLHWSDYSTLDLVSYLARRADPARLMIIGTYRPVDVILSGHPLKGIKRELQAHRMCQELSLECLAEGVITEYLSDRFPHHQFPSQLRKAIYARTEGNPLFMVTMLEYLCDEKMIIDELGTWKLGVDLFEVERGIPGNLRQLIEKQIERLSTEERSVLEAASVAGMECSCAAIAAGLDQPIEWVEKHCNELARKHQFLSAAWLAELPDGTVTPRYRFIHILYRDVPYRLMAAMRRSQIHQRIGERGVAIYGDRSTEIAAELAMHFEQSRDWERALRYLIQAAENAARKSAHHEAAELAQRGLVILRLLPKSTERDQQEIALRMILIVSLMAVKGFASTGVEEVYADGKDLFRLSEPTPQLFNWLYLLGLLHMFRGKTESALEIADRLLDLAEKLKDPRLLMEVHRARGSTLLEMGRCSEALAHVDRASHLYSVHRPFPQTLISGRDCKVLSECSAGKALWALGFPDAAMRRIQVGLEFARELAHPQSLAYAAHFSVQLHQLRGEPLLAQERAREVIGVAEEYCLELWVAYGKIDLGWANAELGEIQQGIEQMRQGLAAYEATGTKIMYPVLLGSLADQLSKAQRIEEGLLAIAKAIDLAERTGEGYALAELHRINGELFMKTSELNQTDKPPNDATRSTALSQARACFARALAIARQQGAKSWELRAALSMHRLDLMLGNPISTQLAEVYSSFAEGYETADLRQAKAFIEVAPLK